MAKLKIKTVESRSRRIARTANMAEKRAKTQADASVYAAIARRRQRASLGHAER